MAGLKRALRSLNNLDITNPLFLFLFFIALTLTAIPEIGLVAPYNNIIP